MGRDVLWLLSPKWTCFARTLGWEQAVEVSFDLNSFTELYDQAGLMLWHGEHQWIKAGVEVNDGVVHVGAVVTDQFSDWSLSPVPEWGGRIVTIRASYHQESVVIRARTDEHPWRTIQWRDLPILRISRQGRSYAHPNGPGLRLLLQDGYTPHQMQTCIPIHRSLIKQKSYSNIVLKIKCT